MIFFHENRCLELSSTSTKETLEHPPYNLDLAPSDFPLFRPLKKHLAGRHFRIDAEVQETVVLSGSATWALISSMPVSIDWLADGTNASTTMVSKWKSNMCQYLPTFVYLFDFVNKPFLSENSFPYFLDHPRTTRIFRFILEPVIV
ncbi:hypothetical protein AVEN_203756-1 [Araneus ventricosus]|uniref:Uncharacterized protein n=1 Tax=Araneus ventricosus TaxID=182803 RepID=A0A4Y2GC82_ARAVE|nr:hypothetical protein AVEN_203756-1 [Araneus ventricosus]